MLRGFSVAVGGLATLLLMLMATPFADRLLPAAPTPAVADPAYWIWCTSVVQGDDGRFHAFVSRWPKSLSFFHWATASEVIRASSDRPEGPYAFEEVVLHRRGPDCWDGMVTHNPAIRRWGEKYLLFYTGSTYDAPYPANESEHGLFSAAWLESWNNKRIGLAIADSVFGPWRRFDKPILQPQSGQWDSVITSNPAPWVREDGSITLIYKSTNVSHPAGHFPGRFHQGVAHASSFAAPFTRLSDGPITLNGNGDTHIEDAFLWWNGVEYELLVKDMTGEVCGEEGAAIHAVSRDAVSWSAMDPAKAYSRQVRWADGSSSVLPKLERPQILFQGSSPTYLFAATLRRDAAGAVTDSFSIAFPLRTT